MSAAGVPTGSARIFTDIESAMIHLATSQPPFVVKADGLAAGKGVMMAPTRRDAERALDSLFVERTVGTAGDTVLIEEWLEGTESSVFAFVDGEFVSAMTAACDYKRALDGDRGQNTGGMAATAPRVLGSGTRGGSQSHDHGASGRADGQARLSVPRRAIRGPDIDG